MPHPPTCATGRDRALDTLSEGRDQRLDTHPPAAPGVSVRHTTPECWKGLVHLRWLAMPVGTPTHLRHQECFLASEVPLCMDHETVLVSDCETHHASVLGGVGPSKLEEDAHPSAAPGVFSCERGTPAQRTRDGVGIWVWDTPRHVQRHCHPPAPPGVSLSHTMYSSISFRKSTPRQNCQLLFHYY